MDIIIDSPPPPPPLSSDWTILSIALEMDPRSRFVEKIWIQIWNKKKKQKKSGSVGRPTDPDLEQKNKKEAL
jgi:hypothetical protein